MIGSFITRGLVMILGYAYPAYECYKTVEKNKPEIEQLRFWCQYWILVASLTVCEKFGDAFVSWIPMYGEVKLLFIVYLWYPKTKGTTYVYDSFFRPYLAKHENEIDQNLLELRTRAGDIAVSYWQRAASYGQTRIFEILQFVAAQSTPMRRPSEPQQGARVRKPPAGHQPATPTKPQQPEEPPSPTSSTTSSQCQEETVEELASSEIPKATEAAVSNSKNQATTSNNQKATAASEKSSKSTPAEVEPVQIEALPSSKTENPNPAPKETVMQETIRVTRGRLRKTRSGAR